ncbi:MAG: hypothetical protein LRY45_02965 [Bacteroides graminisolvens]|nr:hypothetical protein [Bacteroides graminisolvens]
MLIASVGRAGYELSKHFSDWQHSDFKNRCIYTFIPGEIQNPSDSGNLFMRKLRDVLEIDENKFVDYKDIHDLLEGTKTPLPILYAVKFEVHEDYMLLTTSNTDVAIQVLIDDKSLNIKSPGKVSYSRTLFG